MVYRVEGDLLQIAQLRLYDGVLKAVANWPVRTH